MQSSLGLIFLFLVGRLSAVRVLSRFIPFMYFGIMFLFSYSFLFSFSQSLLSGALLFFPIIMMAMKFFTKDSLGQNEIGGLALVYFLSIPSVHQSPGAVGLGLFLYYIFTSKQPRLLLIPIGVFIMAFFKEVSLISSSFLNVGYLISLFVLAGVASREDLKNNSNRLLCLTLFLLLLSVRESRTEIFFVLLSFHFLKIKNLGTNFELVCYFILSLILASIVCFEIFPFQILYALIPLGILATNSENDHLVVVAKGKYNEKVKTVGATLLFAAFFLDEQRGQTLLSNSIFFVSWISVIFSFLYCKRRNILSKKELVVIIFCALFVIREVII